MFVFLVGVVAKRCADVILTLKLCAIEESDTLVRHTIRVVRIRVRV